MKIKQQKLILHFLKKLEDELLKNKSQVLNEFFNDFFTKDELIEILNHSFFDKDLEEHDINTLENIQLLELIGGDYYILSFLIHTLENGITARANYSQSNIDRFFQRTQNEIHYLALKPVKNWDGYDLSNYRSLLIQTGTTKRVFAIFTSDVLAEDVYAVTTKPSYFFDTKEEAEAEIENVVAKGKFSSNELVVHSLWLLT
jgi:hypothetical protein